VETRKKTQTNFFSRHNRSVSEAEKESKWSLSCHGDFLLVLLASIQLSDEVVEDESHNDGFEISVWLTNSALRGELRLNRALVASSMLL
jgi:hypothetical protein